MKKLLFGLLAPLGLFAQGPSPLFIEAKQADSFKLEFISKAKSKIKIDGIADDAAWQEAPIINDFGHASYGARTFPYPKSQFQVLWDDQYLYFTMRCYEDTKQNFDIFQRETADQSRLIFERDCIELHIDGNNDNATRFQTWFINTEEKMMFWHYDFGWGILVNENYGLAADWDYKTTMGQQYWQVEGKIALSHIQIHNKVGTIFGMNPCRFRFRKAGTNAAGLSVDNKVTQFLSWSTQGGSHHSVGNFGKFILVDQQPASTEAGLKLAFKDFDQQKFMIQTQQGFEVFDKGSKSFQSYKDKGLESLKQVKELEQKLDALIQLADNQKEAQLFIQQANKSKKILAKIEADLAQRNTFDAGFLNQLNKQLQKQNTELNRIYWQLKRTLLLAGLIMSEPQEKLAQAIRIERDEPENRPIPSADLIKDAVPWAKQHISGKQKVLFIAAEGSLWDAYEIMARMNLDADVFAATSRHPAAIGPTQDYYKEGILQFPAKYQQLKSLLKNQYDGIIFLDFAPRFLPYDLQYKITEHLMVGTGVVSFQGQRWTFRGYPQRWGTDKSIMNSMPKHTMTVLKAPSWGDDHRGKPVDYIVRREYPFTPSDAYKIQVGKGFAYHLKNGGASYFMSNAIAPEEEQAKSNLFQNEYYFSAACKTILKSLGKHINILELPQDRITKPTPVQKGRFEVLVNKVHNGKLAFTLRNQSGQILKQEKQDVSNSLVYAMELTKLDKGNYYIDVALFNQNGQLLDWASTGLESTLDNRNIKFKQEEYYSYGADKVTIEVDVDNVGPNEQISAQLVDVSTGRIMWQKPLNPKQKQIDVPLLHLENVYHHLKVKVKNTQNQVLAASFTRIYHPRVKQDDLVVFTDGLNKNHQAYKRFDLLKSYGVNMLELGYSPEECLSTGAELVGRYWLSFSKNQTGGSLYSDYYHQQLAQTIQSMSKRLDAYGARFLSTGDDSGVAPDFADNYPNWVLPLLGEFMQASPQQPKQAHGRKVLDRQFLKDRKLKNAHMYWRWLWNASLKEIQQMEFQDGDLQRLHNAFKKAYPNIDAFNRAHQTTFVTFDSISTDDIKKLQPIFSPDELGFQDWLQDKYQNIDRLNEVWGSNAKSFETIHANKMINQLMAQQKYAAKIDKLHFLEDLYIRHMDTVSQAVKSVTPRLATGQGAASFNNIVPDVLAKTDSYIPYLHEVNFEVGRSFPHRYVGQTLGVYGGKSVKPASREQQVWHVLFSGGNFIWFWTQGFGGIMGDLSLNEARSGRMLTTIKEAKESGIASALIRSTREHDGIAILHSRRSGHLSGVIKEMSTQENSQSAMQYVLEDLGLQYQYIASYQIADGILDSGTFKTLVLPYTQALHPYELEAIKKFVTAGGTVIADLRVGAFSEMGQPIVGGSLEEIFGMKYSGVHASPIKHTLSMDTFTSLGEYRSDASVKLTTGKALAQVGSSPALIFNQYGKGQALFLNLGMDAYSFYLNRNTLGEFRDLLKKQFETMGIQAKFDVLKDNESIPGVELARFTYHDTTFLTLEKKSLEFQKGTLKAKLELDQSYYITDMRTGENLGKSQYIPLSLQDLSCKVWALSPVADDQWTVLELKEVKQGGLFQVSIEDKGLERGLFQVKVLKDGNEFFKGMIETENGKGSLTGRIAHNDAKGKYVVQVKSLCNGNSKEHHLTVK